MGFILLPWEHQRTQPWVWGYRDSEERSRALPGIGVLLGELVCCGWAGMGGARNFGEGGL